MNPSTFARKGLPAAMVVLLVGTVLHAAGASPGWTLIGWNDLGMHCMDDDYSAFSILPPYNTIHAQLVDPSGNRITNPSGITVTYEAVVDPSGSINTTSQGKTNFWQFVTALFGAGPPPDEGLAGSQMPGQANTPRPMQWEASQEWFTAEGIPLTPYDDSGRKNYYPMMHLTARDASGNILATTDIVLPVSDEMDCRKCHGSNTVDAARPSAGWVDDPDPVLDYKRNILRLHDDRQGGTSLFSSALSAAGYDPAGLEATQSSGTPILCARCHGSNALPGTGISGVPPLTEAIHGFHSHVVDPATGMALEASANRTACYSCHPGSDTRCLRGAMGHAVNASGELAIQCQNCHGSMSMVGAPNRQGWFDEPNCQSCHTGTATQNAGRIRFTSAFVSPGVPRQAANPVFATNPDTPAPGVSLFRFSTGHGGLQCEACHGSTHAIFPSSHENDNIQSVQLQGSPGTLADCSTCHGSPPSTVNGGPHGLHPIGQQWVQDHHDAGGDDAASFKDGRPSGCDTCHGSDYRGTVLSRSLTDKTVSTPWGSKHFWKGYQIGCYTCHNGPDSEHANPNHAPAVSNANAATSVASAVSVNLPASDADGDSLALRVVSQPAHGRVGISGTTALYTPDPGFSGTDTFTFAAWDGMADSNLGVVSVQVVGSGCQLTCSAQAPSAVVSGQTASFSALVTTSSGCSGTPAFLWNFGDGSTSNAQNPSHAYAAVGTYTWTLTASLNGASCSSSGTIVVQDAGGGCDLSCAATVPASGTTGETVEFQATATPSGCSGEPSYRWDFGDGNTSSDRNPSHTYSESGTYTWSVTAGLSGATCTSSGTISISDAGGPPAIQFRYVTVAAHSEGRNDRNWRTDLAILNLNADAATLRLSFEGALMRSAQTIMLGPDQAMEWRDVLASLFDIGSDASGAVTIRSDQRLMVTSRTYVLGQDHHTIGQYFPAVDPSQGVGAGTVSIIPNISRSEDFLTNLGFLNLTDGSVRVRVTLYADGGDPIGNPVEGQVPAAGWYQINDVFKAAGLGNTDLAWARVEVLTPGGVIWPYASLLDRHTGDPVTIGPFFLP